MFKPRTPRTTLVFVSVTLLWLVIYVLIQCRSH